MSLARLFPISVQGLDLDVARQDGTRRGSGFGCGHQLVGVADVVPQVGEGLALACNSRDLLEPADIPIFVMPVLQREPVHGAIVALPWASRPAVPAAMFRYAGSSPLGP